jgi:3-phosphoshikimate 1-carboxyvinyltransferase
VKTLEIQPATRPVCGTAQVPGSKSITNRALALAALAQGVTVLRGALFADDTARMIDCLRALGVGIDADAANATMTVTGCGGRIPAASADLFVGNSGTTTRFITPLLALGHGEFVVDGVARMRERPIADLITALRQLDVDIESVNGNGCPPLCIRANGLRGGVCTVRADTSSQFLSGLLLAAPCAEGGGTGIGIDGPLLSAPYVAITTEMMRSFGAESSFDAETRTYRVPGRQTYRSPGTYLVEPDASAATYFWAAAAITGGRVRVEGIGGDALQGDIAFVDVLEEMGCRVTRGVHFIEVEGVERLHGGRFDMNAISDTVMTLAAVAVFADGPTVIENVGHIRHKETDRIHAVATELRRLGAEIEERADGLTITPPARVTPATIHTYDDHRMAMAFALVGLRAPGVVIEDPDCVAKTFPDYFACLRALLDESPELAGAARG